MADNLSLEFKLARATLEKDGWQFICTRQSDQGDTNPDYGMLFTRNAVRFWLNKDTYKNLPK